MNRFPTRLVLACLLLAATGAFGQNIASFEKRITVKTLPNGLTLLVCERPEAPVFSFFTHVDAGSAQDPEGSSGLAHMFEHMAFKGTDTIGTKDIEKEKTAIAKVELTYQAYDTERHRETGRDDRKVAILQSALKAAIKEAQQYVDVNQFGRIVEENGGVGMNAFTSMDETAYFYSMPSNRVELWAYLESERFLHPVFREFYKERDVVTEERRMRAESNPVGRMVEQFLAASFEAHPYHHPGLGWPSELNSFSATDAQAFYNKYYVPSNMVIGVVGDVKAADTMPILEKYFSRLPYHPQPPPLRTIEPAQKAERTVIMREATQPFYLEGYHRPSVKDPDDAVYDAISDLLSDGRTSRLYRSLVRDKKIAPFAQGFNGFPGKKYPHLFAFFSLPVPGHTTSEIRDAIHEEIEKVKTQDVSDEELQMIKKRAKANLLRSLGDNEGLANNLVTAQSLYGDWREVFRNVDRIDKVSKADIRRVAAKTFLPTNRTVVYVENAAVAQGGK